LDWSSASGTWLHHPPASDAPAAVQRFLEAREAAIEALHEVAVQLVPRFRRVPEEAAVPVFLLPVHRLGSRAEELLRAWNDAADAPTEGVSHYQHWHQWLLQTDTLRILDANGAVTRLLLLPTHPWLLRALSAFQSTFAADVRSAIERRGAVSSWKFELTRADV